MPNGDTPGVDASIDIKTAEALRLRTTGHTYREIGRKMGIAKSMAHKYVVDALREIREESTERALEVRELELERLDAMLRQLWPEEPAEGEIAPAMDARTADTILRIMERRAALLGLDAPKDTRIGGIPDGQPIQIAGDLNLKNLSVDELRQLERIVEAANGLQISVPQPAAALPAAPPPINQPVPL